MLLLKKVFSSLEGSEVIAVGDPPDNALDALLFWVAKDWVAIPDPEVSYRSYHAECADAVSRVVQWMFPSMFPNNTYESDVHVP